MPSALLSNSEASDIKTREILLHNFYIRCITSFGGKTFGKTYTNTIILFLEHFDFPPQKAKLLKDSANAIVNGENLDDWKDADLFNEYLKTIDTTKESYLQFVSKAESLFENSFAPYFKEYETAFRNRTSTKNAFGRITETERKENAGQPLKRNEKSSDEQKQMLNNEFFDWVKEIEANKILIFALTYQQQTLIITAPTDNIEQKQFLGYTSSERRGSEGLKETGGLLTNISNRNDEQKLAWFVRKTFNSEQCKNEELEKYAKYVQTSNMLSFSKPTFDMQIKLSADKKVEVMSKYPLVKLGDIADVLKGKSITSAQAKEGNIKVVAGGIDYAYLHNESNRPANTITISASGANAGFVNFWEEPIFASDCTTVRGRDILHTKFLYYFLFSIQNQIYSLQKGSAQPHVYPDDIRQIQVPDVNDKLQEQIVSECEQVDDEYNLSYASIEENKKKIFELFEKLQNKSGIKYKELQSLLVGINGNKTKIAENLIMQQGKYPVITQESDRLIAGYTNDENVIDDLPLIVFGDHSCTFKYIDFPFVRGADGTQLLKVDAGTILPKFLYEYLQTIQIENAGKYERHYKYLKQIKVPVPSLSDQERIVSEIETYNQKISEAKAVMASCAERKKQILEKWLK